MTTAQMSASDLAAIITSVMALGAVLALTLVLASLLRTLRTVRADAEAFRVRSTELLDEMTAALNVARTDLERVDDLVGSAEALAATVDGAAKVGYFTVGKPVIKTVALAKGTSRAAKRIRGSKAG